MVHPAFRGYVKVGRTDDPPRRLRQANTWCPGGGYEYFWLMSTPHPQAVESMVHAGMSECRRDGEWFYCSPPLTVTAVREADRRLRAAGIH